MAIVEVLISSRDGSVCGIKPPGVYWDGAVVHDWIHKDIEPDGLDDLYNAEDHRRAILDARFFLSGPTPSQAATYIQNRNRDPVTGLNPPRMSDEDAEKRIASEVRDANKMIEKGLDSNWGRDEVRKDLVVRADLTPEKQDEMVGKHAGQERAVIADWKSLVSAERVDDIENGRLSLPPRGDGAASLSELALGVADIVGPEVP